jgi:acetyl esterase/lipase
MRLDEYPPQEPLSARGQPYSRDLWVRSEGVAYDEVRYGDDPYQRIAIVSPKSASNGAVLVFLHGGGWTGGYKEWNLFMAPRFADAGVTFVSPGYRLAPATIFPGNLEDAIRALVWVHKNIATYAADNRRVFIGGHSAGGHLTALLAVSRSWRMKHGLPPDFIAGCLPVSGVYRFGEGSGLSMRPRFLGPDSATDLAASPILQLEKPLPPFFIAYGELDFPHLVTQAHEMVAALRAGGADVEEMMFPGKTHHEAHLSAGDPQGTWLPTALQFIRRNSVPT